MEDSLLSSFNQDALMIDLIKPLFKLRLDKNISSFISEKLLKERARITRKFGKGVKGEEYFTSSYNNAVVDYIYQNYMSNFTDPVNGKHITIPKALSSKDVIIDNTIQQDVIVGKNIIVNEEKLKSDFDNKIFLNDDALDVFEKNKNPFQTFSSYVRYVMEREVLRDSLVDTEVTEEYLSEVALLKSFNSPYIMGKTKYSYSESIMNIINNFDDTKVNFPVLNHIILKSNKRNINKVLTLNKKSLLTKEISSIYNKNLKDLADPTINKDKKSLEFFKPFSLILFYQHGFGNSKLSINRVLDAKKFTDEMIDASTFFINDLESKDFSAVTLNNIFSKVIDVKNRQFIEYTENADQYNNPVKKDIDDGIEIEFDLEPVIPTKSTKTSTSVVERTNKIILRSELKANPTTLYLFGDNDIRKGLGGQAKEMRGEPNAVGVSTKKLPARSEEAYKSDTELEKNKKIITDDINKAIAEWNTGKYSKLIIPQMGVGLAELPTRAPETYKFLQQELKRLEDQVTKSSTSVPIKKELEGLNEAREVYESLFIANGKPPITFTVGVSTWKLNKNFNYDLIDQDTGEVLLANVNMVTGIIEEDVVEYTILTKKQLNDYIKDFENKVVAYNLDELLAIFGINIQDVYKKLNEATTTEDLIEIETEINRKLCQ